MTGAQLRWSARQASRAGFPLRNIFPRMDPGRRLPVDTRTWCRLAMSGNPTASELVWLPDDLYLTRTRFGDELIGIRTAFLSAGFR